MPDSLEEKKELEGIKYLKENNDMTDPKIVLNVYNRMVEGRIFRTKVGTEYLRELQEYLLSNGVDRSLIKAIPIIEEEEIELVEEEPLGNKKGFKPVERKNRQHENKKENVSTEDFRRKNAMDASGTEKISDIAKTAKKKEKSRANKDIDAKENKYRERFHISLILNIVLVAVIIILFFIAASKDNPTVLNYEEKLLNKYSSWAEELESRERELNEREESLPLNMFTK